VAKDFEDFMQEKHCEQFIGTKDMLVDNFPEWLEDLDWDDWFKFGDMYSCQRVSTSVKQLRDAMLREMKFPFTNPFKKGGR